MLGFHGEALRFILKKNGEALRLIFCIIRHFEVMQDDLSLNYLNRIGIRSQLNIKILYYLKVSQ